jgi:predicted PurR-regulated permease PerM
MPSMQGLLEAGQGYLSEHASSAASLGRSLAETVSLSVVALIVTIYLVVQPTQLVNGFVSLFPAKQRERIREVLGKMYYAVQKWFLGQRIMALAEPPRSHENGVVVVAESTSALLGAA